MSAREDIALSFGVGAGYVLGARTFGAGWVEAIAEALIVFVLMLLIAWARRSLHQRFGAQGVAGEGE